jgi:hypothetical protein
MKHFLTLLCLTASGAALASGQETKPPAQVPKPALVSDGPLREVRQPLGQIFQFTIKDGKLQLDRQGWGKAAKGAAVGNVVIGAAFSTPAHPLEIPFRQIQTAAKTSSSGMSISGREREVRFSGTNLAGRLLTRADSVRMSLDEIKPPQRTLEFSEDSTGGFRLQLVHPDGDLIFVSQGRNGSFAGVAMVGGKQFAGRGESFVAFYRQHRADVEAHILPALEQFGIQLMLSPQEPKVRQAVLALVTRTPEKVEEGRKLLVELDSQKFAVRNNASQLLNDRFELYKDLIQEKLQEKSLPLEVRTRLQNIQSRHADSEKVGQAVAALELLKDGRYLVSLFDHAAGEETPLLIRHLEKTTGQRLGTDPAAWKEWARKKGS